MSNKVISIEYTLNDATTKEKLDTNVGGAPLEFITGQGQIIPGLEKEIDTLAKGESVDVVVQPEEAYGEYSADALQTLPKEQFAGVDLTEGMTLYGTGENGETVQVTVKSLGENDVTIDYNHPLAGKTLMFNVSILDVRDATDEEIQMGVVGGMAAAGSCGCGDSSCDTPEPAQNDDSCCGTGHCS
jgi:FKBP-type peptidyl-prolyl cis-trans isomerase SlyD